jgi:glycosyltransferase 2 family protein
LPIRIADGNAAGRDTHRARAENEVTITIAPSIFPRLSRSKISIAVSLAILAVAGITFYQLVRDVDFGKVKAAIEAQSMHQLAVAGALVVAGYVTLTFYDLFALRLIGRRGVPYSVAALASFASSTIGHNLGAAVLTGGLIRLRIYSVWGLTVADVARIALVTGMTFVLGNAALLGATTAYAPGAASVVDHLSPSLNRAIGVVGLVVLACYLLWLRPRRRTIGHAAWRLVLPSLPFTLLQIAIGALDLLVVTSAMYTLLPPNPAVGFASVLVIFLTATLLGAASHAPGGLGVIEVTMLLGLPQFAKEELLAALLTFRTLYYVLPLLIAAASLGMREMWMLARPARRGGDDVAP